jgi:hypothetical protein
MMDKWITRSALLIVLGFGLSVRADAPANRYMFPTADTVYDTRTKLTWQRKGTEPSFTQSAAVSYCSGLQLANGGWRLPTRAELLSIVDPTRRAPSMDPYAFAGEPDWAYWTSSRFVPEAGKGWIIGFTIGESSDFETSVECSVRCVR